MNQLGRTWLLAEPANGVKLQSEEDGVYLRGGGIDLSTPGNSRGYVAQTRLGRLLPALIPQVLELGMASVTDGDIRFLYEDFVELEPKGITAFDGICPWAPFTLEVKCEGSLGTSSFRCFHRFYLGSQVIHPKRLGCFVRRGDQISRLDAQLFVLIEAIEALNALAPQDRSTFKEFSQFASIKGLAEGVGAQLDRYLVNERVLIPSRIALDLVVEGEDRISFFPKVDGVDPEAMKRVFFALDGVDDVYDLDHPDGGRIRVVLDEAQREVLRRMQKVRHLGGAEKIEVLRNPHAVFDGIAEAVDVDDSFGPRVKAIGDFPFVVQPYLRWEGTGIFKGPEGETGTPPKEAMKFSAGIQCRYADGSITNVPFSSREEILDLQEAARRARLSGQATIDFAGKIILADESLVRALDELAEHIRPSKRTSTTSGRYLLIYDNENEVEYAEDSQNEEGKIELTLPKSIAFPDKLRGHQRWGIAWLQRNFALCREGKRRGCLLADDMGLGKTLQLLTFLAWLIEEGEIAPDSANPESAPWNPILIVAPVILLDNETWLNDMRSFFRDNGDIFRPWLVLHGSELQSMRRRDITPGRETSIGEAVLDLEKLRNYRVVLTNYETVTNYQHSFARMKDHWTVVVTDEAQEYKTPNTKVSHALKSLSPRFRIACTGTPVETRLLDVWNIFDFLQPGSLLGSAAEFTKKYEAPLADSLDGLGELRERLQFGRPSAFVLRREKSTLSDLPRKVEHSLKCHLSSEQRQWHLDLVSQARLGGAGNHPLRILQQLMMVYQHPDLVSGSVTPEADEAIQRCPKLARMLECIQDIRSKRQKVLVFTRSVGMQQILASVISSKCEIGVGIVNGSTKRNTRTGNQTRSSIISRFREGAGFGALVLSPDVAGIGLTIVEANHVIHYGRWWNPARESQATDRVYRIGQKNDVHVHYLIAEDPQSVFETFDEKLDTLIRRRRKLAADFLAPIPGEDELGQELLGEILDENTPPDNFPVSQEHIRRMAWDRFEALIALLEEKNGATVILTPRAGDGGVDVVAAKDRNIRLIQCKHTLSARSVDVDAIAEIVRGFDGYRNQIPKAAVSRFALSPVLVTNGSFTAAAQSEARQTGVYLLGEPQLRQLLERYPCTPGEIERMEDRRLTSMRGVKEAIERLATQ